MSREARASDLFARRKAQHVMRALVENLGAASSLPYLVQHDQQPMRGVPAFVVGAGPSLSDSLPLLPRCAEVGYVFAVNASVQAVSRVVTPDVLVVRESIDVSAQLDGVRAGLVALDVCASPAVWRAAERVGERGWWLSAAVQHFAIAGLLCVRPVYGGPSAMTAAVALAHAWGASPIVLVGCDLAFGRDGQGYARESGWGDVRGEVLPHDIVRLGGLEHMRGVVAASGQAPPPEVQETERLLAWGGEGEVTSLLTWGDQVRWLRDFAARKRPSHAPRLMNATGAGARIDGWEELALERAVRKASMGSVARSRAARIDGQRIDTRPALDALRADADALLSGTPRLTTGVVEAMAAGAAMAAQEAARGDMAAAIRGTQAAIAEAAEWTAARCT